MIGKAVFSILAVRGCAHVGKDKPAIPKKFGSYCEVKKSKKSIVMQKDSNYNWLSKLLIPWSISSFNA